MSDKPLHVQVAEALGCKPRLWPEYNAWTCECLDRAHADTDEGSYSSDAEPWKLSYPVKEYRTDWSATGPLIEKMDISVCRWMNNGSGPKWEAMQEACLYLSHATLESHADIEAGGRTPLEAVCNLIVELHRARKLRLPSPLTP